MAILQYDYQLEIYLPNGTIVTLGTVQNADPLIKNKLESVSINRTVSSNNQNPVGVISSDTCSITIKSYDRSLSPLNKQSPYAGQLNSKAFVKLSFRTKVKQPEPPAPPIPNPWEDLGRFYVSTWDDTSTGDKTFSVRISCIDWIGATLDLSSGVLPSDLTYGRTNPGIYLSELLKSISVASSKYSLDAIKPDYSADFAPFALVNFYTIDRSSIQSILNYLTQSTLTNFYINRKNVAVLDSLTREKKDIVEYTVSDITNTISAEITSQSLWSYDKINVLYNTYILGKKDFRASNEEVVASFKGIIPVIPGTQWINQSLNIGNDVMGITTVLIRTDNTPITTSEVGIQITNSGKSVMLSLPGELTNGKDIEILIYGLRSKTGEESLTPESELVSSKVLNVNNKVLTGNNITEVKDSIVKYRDMLLNIQQRTEEIITVRGFYDLKLELGNIIRVELTKSMSVSGTFKIVGIDLAIGESTIQALRLQRIEVTV